MLTSPRLPTPSKRKTLASPFASPSNADFVRHAHSVRRGSDTTIKEKSIRHFVNIKDFKAGPLEKGKLMIEAVHSRLKGTR
jgi:hypothetical protein